MAKHISVKGVVQGVGFRPFVYGLATRLDLHGWMGDTIGGVEILVDGENGCIDQFIRLLDSDKPPLASIESIQVDEAPPDDSLIFEIREVRAEPCADLSPFADLAICRDCERELFHPKDPRYLYPFISCSHCGPRFTILKDMPYYRSNTTMAEFPMCERCYAEYTDPVSRRFRAHSIACPECGPFVELRETHTQFPTATPLVSSIEIRVSAILKARRLLREGYVIAIKGPGGFQLVCDASNPFTLAELRDRQGRTDEPFAVMGADLAAISSICEMQPEEQLLLTGREKPVVLLERKKSTGSLIYKASELIAPYLDTLGAMLPYAPIHHLLINQTDPVLAREPVPPVLVLTDGNRNQQPIAIDNKDALGRLSSLTDAFLLHNGEILVGLNNSIVRINKSKTVYLLRSCGSAPYLIELPFPVNPTLALGAESNTAFGLARGRSAFLSHHIGNFGESAPPDTLRSAVQRLSQLLRVQPEIIAHDFDPDYLRAHFGEGLAATSVAVQHHHAHIAACMADNGLGNRQVIGLCFDGPAYGTDGAFWGGEVLLASYEGFQRFAHLEYLPLPGREPKTCLPWQLAAGYAHALRIPDDNLVLPQSVDKNTLGNLRQQIDGKTDSPCTSSVMLLFDAVASMIGIRHEVSYEAQSVAEMEVLAKPFLSAAQPYPCVLDESGSVVVIRLKDMFLTILRDISAAEPVGSISARFHKTVARIAVEVSMRARDITECNMVVLSGSVWQNQLLLDLVQEGLQQEGFLIFFHRQVPTNDGGLALGQVVIANCETLSLDCLCAGPENPPVF